MNQNLSPAQQKSAKLTLYSMILIIIGSLGIDQVTKVWSENNYMVWEHDKDLKQYQGKRDLVVSFGEQSNILEEQKFYLAFSFNYIRNQGAAWGALSDWDDTYRIPFFYVVTFLAVLVIFMYLKTTPLSHRVARFALVLIMSGALGNFTDRILRGFVIDFLDFRWVIPLPMTVNIDIDFFPSILSFLNFSIHANSWRYNFPNFNWADSAITVGVIFLIFDMLILEHLRMKQFKAESSEGSTT